MAYTRAQARKLADGLRSLPTPEQERRNLDKQGMVTYLAAEIIGLQERGYTLEQVALALRSAGLDITKATLKTYLRRMKQRAHTGPRKRAGRSGARRVGRPRPRGTRLLN
jgi:hypothetical protein